MKKAKSTWKPFDAVLSGSTTYHFDTEEYTVINAGDVATVVKRWGDILDMQDMSTEQVFDQGGVVEAPTNSEPVVEVPEVPEP